MPSRVKLLNAAAAGFTGTVFKSGMSGLPYSIYTQGGYGLGGGAAGTQGVNIEVSHDNVQWERGIGVVGGENYTEATSTVQELVDLPDKTVAYIQQHHTYIRAKTGSGLTGSATCYFEAAR
jgi:hypothetical protein